MKSLLIIAVFCFGLNSCRQDDAKVLGTNKSFDSVKEKSNKIVDSIGIVYSNDHVKVYGNSYLNDSAIYVEVKFEPFITFEDYIVDVLFNGKKSPINYKSHPLARECRTVITKTYKRDGVTFGGHYTFVYWDCGMPCLGSAIVDLVDGKVYEGVHSQSGYSYKPNSRMLIVNPPDSTGFYQPTDMHGRPEIWIWDEKAKEFVEKQVL